MKKNKRTADLISISAIIALAVLLLCFAGCSSGNGNDAAAASTGTESDSGSSERTAEEIAFEEDVQALLKNIMPDTINGNKAASIIIPEDARETYFSLDATPESLRTNDASQVRYIIRRYESKEIVGQYTGGNSISGMAYQLHYVVEIEDLKFNGILDAVEFLGGEPPATISAGESPIGSEPDIAEINAWIVNTIKKGEFVGKQPLLVKVPEGWGTPYIEYRDNKSLSSKVKTKPLVPNGEWYSIMMPTTASELTVMTHMNTLGTDNFRRAETIDFVGNNPGWIIVENLEGKAAYYDHEPTA